ncbi:hypothetical protein [Halomonas sp. WWR20]
MSGQRITATLPQDTQERSDEKKFVENFVTKKAAHEGGVKTVTSLMRRNHGREPDFLPMACGAWQATAMKR